MAKVILLLNLIVIAVLTGCDSGGTPSGSAHVEPPTEDINYRGSLAPAVVDEASAVTAAQQWLLASDTLFLVESLWLELPPSVEELRETVKGPEGGSFELNGYFSGADYVLEFRFRDYKAEGALFNGFMEQRVERTTLTNPQRRQSPVTGEIRLRHLRLVTDSINTVLDGTLRGAASGPDSLTANLVLLDTLSDETLLLEDFSIRFSGEGEASIEGKISQTALGTLSVRTIEPVVALKQLLGYWIDSSPCPTASGGYVQISGVGEVQLVMLSRRFVSLVLSGENGQRRALRLPWQRLAVDAEPAITTALATPTANAGRTRYGSVGVPMEIHGLFSWDEDEEFLSYDWKLIYAPNDSQVQRSFDSAVFTFIPDLQGDYVFDMAVSDGVNMASSRLTISVGPPPVEAVDPVLLSQHTAALEVRSSDGGTRYQLDAGSVVGCDPPSYAVPEWELSATRGSVPTLELDFDVHNFTSRAYSVRPIYGSYRLWYNYLTIRGSQGYDLTFGSWLPTEVDLRVDGAASTAIDDINGDGLQDLILPVGHFPVSGVEVWLRRPQGGFDKQRFQINAGNGMSRVVKLWGDLGAQIVVASDEHVLIFELTADGIVLTDPLRLSAFPDSCDDYRTFKNLEVLDLDFDGDLDIAALHPCEAGLVVWWHEEPEQFSTPSLLPLQAGDAERVVFGLLNDDDMPDLVLTADGISTLFLNEGGRFRAADNLELAEGRRSGAVLLADFDSDGRDDLVHVSAASFREPSNVDFYSVGSDGSLAFFGSHETSTRNYTSAAMDSGDLDNDGDIDLVLGQGNSIAIFLREHGRFELIEIVDHIGVGDKEGIRVVDLNNDGKMDVLTTPGGAVLLGGGNNVFTYLSPPE